MERTVILTLLRAIGWAAVSTKVQAADDKSSLEQQESEIRKWCEESNYLLVELMTVPGHSRNFRSVEAMNRAMLKDGINAVDRFIKHIEARDFDVLIVRSIDRLGRTQGVISQMIEMVIEDAGAKIFTFGSGTSGWLDNINSAMQIAIAGFMAATHKKNMRDGNKHGKHNRVMRGLPQHSPPYTHTYIRDGDGVAIRLVVDESKRKFMDAARDLLLDGTAWTDFSDAMKARGFINLKTGRPFNIYFFKMLFHMPTVWGNIMERDTSVALNPNSIYGRYAFNPNIPPPPGITIHRNTHEPAWTGEDARRIQAHLNEIRTLTSGQARPKSRTRFSRLIVCARCGRSMTYCRPKEQHGYYRCNYSHSGFWQRRDYCDNKTYIREDEIEAWVDDFLRRAMKAKDPNQFFASFYPAQPDYSRQISAVEADLKKIQAKIAMFIAKQGDNPELADSYDAALKAAALEKQTAEALLDSLVRGLTANAVRDHANPLKYIAQHYDTFWSLSDTSINTLLAETFAGLRIIVDNGDIVGFGLPPPRK